MSGGLDSALVAHLLNESGVEQLPLYVNYGQLNLENELASCRSMCRTLGISAPTVVDLQGLGAAFPCGLTSKEKDVLREAFLPGRNAFLLLTGAAFAYQNGADVVTIGLLSEVDSLFPDQTSNFLSEARLFIAATLGRPIAIRAPLMEFRKSDVVKAARERGIEGTYSCHRGGEKACGSCIACREYIGTGG
jgi:7-cyano-7-deazaguanine synthase